MVINKIVLENFRVYYGINEVDFSTSKAKNVTIIAGDNGFGKTSLLTSLVWCLYGKLISDVDDRYRSEIYESGGYKRYCEKIMNWRANDECRHEANKLRQATGKASYADKKKIDNDIDRLLSFSVSIHFGKLFIPSVPCDEVIVKRSYNIETHYEKVEILIDGKINQLTKDKKENIFINDFILPKEIAKFFFFDAEKIVSLAEINTIEEKKKLSYAYAEVLGIKKYADLRENLLNYQMRIRNKSSNKEDKERQEKLQKAIIQNNKMIEYLHTVLEERREELVAKKRGADHLQEQLIREGSSLSISEFKEFKKLRDDLANQSQHSKSQLKELMEFVPFAIAGKKMQQVKEQLDSEQAQTDKATTGKFLNKKAKEIKAELQKNKRKLGLRKDAEALLMNIIETRLNNGLSKDFKVLLHFSEEKQNEFYALHSNLSNSFSRTFRQINSDLKRQISSLMLVQHKLTNAESKANDPVVKKIREKKQRIDTEISSLEQEIISLEAQLLKEQQDLNTHSRKLSEISKNIRVEEKDQLKDETAARLIGELTEFIRRLKVKKKNSLEGNIQRELNRLMHKRGFVSRVDVVIEGDLIDVELYDKKNKLINKEGLSKGEQQLYATALLKALIAESNIQFPVFIDSPLQKFDKEHSHNIITDFYPKVSGQVVLLPLLDKELTESEYKWLLPHIAGTSLIRNTEEYSSTFVPVKPEQLFRTFRKEEVYA